MSALLFALALGLALVAAGCGACPETGWLARVPDGEQQGTPLVAAVDCAAGAADCNVCASKVVAQLESGSWRPRRQVWSFQAPALAELSPARAYAPGLLSEHAQGFVRLNGGAERYALLHSQRGPRASLSFVGARSSGLALESLYRLDVDEGHTSGAFVLGRHVGYIDAPRRLVLVDSEAAFAHQRLRVQHLSLQHVDPEQGFMAEPRAHGLTDWSGGVAMARLGDGRYLLIANEGGRSAGDSHFFELGAFTGHGSPLAMSVQEVGEASTPLAERVCADQSRSENVALITECETGHVFAVHVGSNDRFRHGKLGRQSLELGAFQTFWRVSRVVSTDEGIGLEPVGVYLRKAQLAYCHGRSAGTAYVHPDTHTIELLCHERAQSNPSAGLWRFLSTAVEPAAPLAPSPGLR